MHALHRALWNAEQQTHWRKPESSWHQQRGADDVLVYDIHVILQGGSISAAWDGST
jgi:hypothetical protein